MIEVPHLRRCRDKTLGTRLSARFVETQELWYVLFVVEVCEQSAENCSIFKG